MKVPVGYGGRPGRRVRIAQRRAAQRRRTLVRCGLLVTPAVVAACVALLAAAATAPADTGAVTAVGTAATPASPAALASPVAVPSGSPSASSAPVWTGPPSYALRLRLRKTIGGAISPKSVVATQTGYVFAQNMMYTHTVTVYGTRRLKLVKTIQDKVDLGRLGFSGFGIARGAPVEAAVAADRRAVYVSNYSMYGAGFGHEGSDVCSPSDGIDRSFVYRVDLRRLRIDQAIRVGRVPKFLATTPDGRYLLVSNWCSYSLSVVDVARGRQVREIRLGPYPRGIAVDPASRYAYVAVMGTSDIARIDLRTFKVRWFRGVGAGPRHLCMSPSGRWLFVTFNSEGTVAKIDLRRGKVVRRVVTGNQTRSMTIAPDGKSLYVVNYESGTVSKVRAADLKVIQVVSTAWHPIGITYDAATRTVWVACYGGSIMVFKDAVRRS
jgi:YVTN family beta-propeller protein